MLNTPVLFLIFNRPDVTELVFEAIKKAKPKKLFVAADGPRSNKPGEKEKCEETRKLVLDGIDWDCEVKTLFREENLGCKYAVSGAISWFFENVEEGIILEDDCLPDPDFFKYCSELLEKYRNDSSVMHIGSNNFNNVSEKRKSSYYFSSYVEIWGWATWRRAWKLYDPEMKAYPGLDKSKFLKNTFKSSSEREYWTNCFNTSFENKVDTWDYQWVFCVYLNSGLCITPYTNLVTNLGFRPDATHTTTYHPAFSNMKALPIGKLVHPAEVKISWEDDGLTFKNIYQSKTSFKRTIFNAIKKNKLLYDLLKRAYNKFYTPTKTDGWFGNYASWAEAEKLCTGYNSENILEKVKNAVVKVKNGEAVYERDSVLFDKIQYSQPLIDAFKMIAQENNQVLHVTDFGGSLGSSFFQNRSFLSDLTELKWSVVEQKHFVDSGKQHIEGDQLKFYYTIDEALTAQKPQVLFLSSVIQYFEKPYELIEKCLSYNFDYIIIDRTAFLESEKERITVQIVPEWIYKASYPAWFFNEKKFVSAFQGNYTLINEFDSKFDPREQLEDKTWSYRKGFVFKKK